MKIKGVSYDVGRDLGVSWRPVFDARVVRSELAIIRDELHCNAVRICGLDIKRLVTAAGFALDLGLEVWLSPEMWDREPQATFKYMLKAAAAAEPLRQRFPDRLLLCVGSELTLFMQGIVPGKSFMDRLSGPGLKAAVDSGKHNPVLNEFLARTTAGVREVFHGRLSYASLPWEQVDWSLFDAVGVDHYWDERIQDRYVDMLKPLFASGKPVVVTEFGFRTYRGAEKAGAMGLGNTDNVSLMLHQLPLVGRFFRPRLERVYERDEGLQARRDVDQLALLDRAGVDGAFLMTFVAPIFPYNEEPQYDLDRDNFSLVMTLPGGRCGTTFPGLPWEPKQAFRAVADYYAKH